MSASLANHLGFVIRRQMTVMLHNHFHIAVAQVLGDDHRRHTGHDRQRGVGMPQLMEADGGLDAGGGACLGHGVKLCRLDPGRAIGTGKDQIVSRATCTRLDKEIDRLPGLARRGRPAVRHCLYWKASSRCQPYD
jgi:hypothetical protein